MIGFFDSGYGGLMIMRECQKALPNIAMLYFGDNARAPYGSRSQEEIFQFTLEGVEFLFSQGCSLVILACNTASANALRRIQQEVLPKQYPDKNVLGILVPTVELVTGAGWSSAFTTSRELGRGNGRSRYSIGIFATPATVASHAYQHEITKRLPDANVIEVACPELVPRIEAGASLYELRPFVHKYAETMKQQGGVDAILLGCTHYPLIRQLFAAEFPGVRMYDQASIVAQSLVAYLKRHQNFVNDHEPRLAKFFTSGNPESVAKLASTFFGRDIIFYTLK